MAFLDVHIDISRRLVQRTPLAFQRYLLDQIDWRQPLVFVVGMRGVGKTTLLLQHLKRAFRDTPDDALYLTADDVNLSGTRLVDVAESFASQHAGKTLVVDEIHKYPEWNRELKNIFDLQPDLRVVASGSSSLDILRGQYDLSRRSLVYPLPQLSLREFVNLSLGLELPPYPLERILEHHASLAESVVEAVATRDTTILERLQAYFRVGAYPYFQNKAPFDFHQQVVNAITKVLYEDIPSTFGTASQTAVTLQRLLNLITTSEPYQPNVERLARTLGIARETTYNYLDHLERSSLLRFLPQAVAGAKAVRKPAKIYLANPTLYTAVGGIKGLEVKEGTLRESFFLSQLGARYRISAHERADVVVHADEPLVFEVGGKAKSRRQLPASENAYRALADIEYGSGRRVPLWLFGFLY